jgi:integrase/recombinase XerD
MTKTPIIPMTREEMNRLIDASIGNDFYYLLFKLARKTGRRLGEYYEIQVKDIDFERKVVMTKILKRRKRVLKEALLDEELTELLKRYIKINNLKPEDFIFKKVHRRTIQYAIVSYGKKAKINHKISFHNFRHYLITELFKKGYDYSQIAKLTGHSSISTLSIYDSSIASDVREMFSKDLKDL